MSPKSSGFTATPYPDTDESETRAINTLVFLLRDRLVKPHLAKGDKRPSIDGDIELLDLGLSSIGKLEVQVKSLNRKDRRRQGYSCGFGFLAYCARSLLPVLLIGVDSENELALWEEITRPLANSLLEKVSRNGKASATVKFPVSNIIKRGSKEHIAAWQGVVERHQRKLEFHDEFSPKAARLREIGTCLELVGPGIPDLHHLDFTNIQRHIDEINGLLGSVFPTVRDALFPDAWKIGLAFTAYADSHLCYCYYPIRSGINDLLVRRISAEVFEGLPYDGNIHPFENPIQRDPVGFAREYVERQVISLLEDKAFRFDDPVLCREFLFAVGDALHLQLGLRTRKGVIGNVLNLKDFAYGWTQYLPRWVEFAINAIPKEIVANLRSVGSLDGYVDLGALAFSLSLSGTTRSNVTKAIRAGLVNDISFNVPFAIGTHDLPLYQVARTTEVLLGGGENDIQRLYTPFDYSRLPTEGGLLSYCWTFTQCLLNLRLFYRELPRLFDHVVEANFPSLRRELRYFGDFDRRIMILSGNGTMGYHLEFCDLQSQTGEPANRIDLYAEKDGIELPDMEQRSTVIDGVNCDVVRTGSVNPSFIFRPLPLFNEIVAELRRRVRGLELFARRVHPPTAEVVEDLNGELTVRALESSDDKGSISNG